MTRHPTEREQQRLRDVAREYRQRGYDVVLDPRPDQLPDFLAPFRIAMLARSREENVVVEVRSQASLTDTPKLDAIAQALQQQPAWRFELVVTNPRDRSALPFKAATSLTQREIGARLREARQLSDQEHGEAALLLAWSATEAILRSIAATEGIAVSQHDPWQVTKSLFIAGVLDPEQYQTLQDALHARTLVVHGYQAEPSLAEIVRKVLHVAEHVQRHALGSASPLRTD